MGDGRGGELKAPTATSKAPAPGRRAKRFAAPSAAAAPSASAAPGASAAPSGSLDIEEFAKNLARMVEQGGKALAAYLKPREEGRIHGEYAEFIDVVKTLGQVGQYWLKDPQRALDLQLSLGRSYLDLWAGAVKRMAGEKTAAGRRAEPEGQALQPTPNGRATSSSTSSSRPIC